MKEMKDDEIIDEENLDSIEKINIPTPNRKKIFAVFIIGAIAITTILVVIILSISIGHKSLPKTPKNMILLIGDGFGPTSANLARQFKTEKKLYLDDYLVGTLRTFSTKIITDSAAGATAFSCGNKTNNGFIATTPDNKACGTVMEAAVIKGMKTGIVCTSRLTDATPACFSSHSNSRAAEYFIAKQQVKQNIDVLFGGGATLYDQKDESNVSPIDTATSNGYKIVRTAEEFRQIPATSKDKFLSVFAAADMSWEIDRDSEKQPSLSEMSAKAISLLSNSKTGFFLMIEGSKIDKAGHLNDAATQYRETVEFDNAFKVALDFAKKDGNTLVISIADHETGGLALGKNLRGPSASTYDWYPTILSNQNKSIDFIVAEIKASRVTLEDAFKQYVGFELSEQDIASVNSFSDLKRGIAEVINQKALVGWSTWGHTSLDVDLYCYHVNPDLCAMFSHNNDNTIVGDKISKLFEFDLMEITEKLKDFSVSSNEKKEFDVYHSF